MKFVGQELTLDTKHKFETILPDTISQLIGEDRIYVYGLSLNHKPVGVVAAEYKNRNMILFFTYIQPDSPAEETIVQSMLQLVEEQSRKHGAVKLISFHPEHGLMARVTNKLRWTSRKSQTQFTLVMKNIDRPIPSHLDNTSIQHCSQFQRSSFLKLMEKISTLAEQWQQPCPPISALHQQTSYLLLQEKRVIGWLLSVENQDPHTASVSRYFVLPDYRHLSISHRYLSYALADMQHNQALKYLTLNVEHSNQKLETIVNRGFLGEVIKKVTMHRTVKDL